MLIADWRNNGIIIGPGSAPAFVPGIRAIVDSRAMADGPWTVTATCAHCCRTPPLTSCPVGPGAGYHCLCAQGWFRSPSKSRNWSCPLCCREAGYWKAPAPEHMSCVHGRRDAPPGLHADAPPFYPGQHAHALAGLRVDAPAGLPGQHADALPGLLGQTPPPPPQSTCDAINNILQEIETMNARLAELSLLLRDLLGRQQNAENADGRLGRPAAATAD